MPGSSPELLRTGTTGLDDVLGGGLTRNRIYLVDGHPGSGKTTLALQFLLEGARRGESVLYVTLSESREELEAVARSHGWSLDNVTLCELMASEESLDPDAQYTMFHPSEVELSETTRAMLDMVDKVKPTRVVVDSLSELRLLAQNHLRLRRQILALKQFFVARGCTVLLLDDRTAPTSDPQLHSLAHGVILLEQLAPEYGAERRRLRVSKLRATRYRGGFHDFVIVKGGLRIFPRLVAAEHARLEDGGLVSSGVDPIDALLGGGLDAGTSALIVGPAGSGKSTIAVQYAVAAAERGQRASIFTFDESLATVSVRARALGLALDPQVEAGRVMVKQVDPAELSPGEFAAEVRAAADGGAKVIVIDSLNGYLNAMPDERFLQIQLHELLTYLGQRGVLTFVIVAQHGLLGGVQSPIDTSYLADSVILLRYYEDHGEVRQAISVMKKRSGTHERTIRAFGLSSEGIRVGEPIRNFQGVLTGIPTLVARALEEGPNGAG